MKIAVLGTRGFPNIQGGVETHCEHLYTRLAGLGCEVIVFIRKPYVKIPVELYKGVKLVSLCCPRQKYFETVVHTFTGIFAARRYNPDILHVHALGPSLCVPLARLLGMKVVVTHHGPDYKRKKWNRFAKTVLRLGEFCAARFAHRIIAISVRISRDVKEKYGRDTEVIPNGVELPAIAGTDGALKRYGLVRGRYILAVARLVPEKGLHDLVESFAAVEGVKLVIVGKADQEDEYSRFLQEKAGRNKNIVMAGFLNGKSLQELYSHAGLFVLPAYYEGLPIVLLEAMSYGLSCVVSDIAANRELGLADERYFPAGDVKVLAKRLKEFVNKPLSGQEKQEQLRRIEKEYNWDTIARQTMKVYKTLIKT
ncbi:MAG: glycosyltransferase family 4 protein [Candidatus Omnitrophica bacterium]|nr:glycosyltransferase family 4 protein [Candidatus Omnitrophota bacterium]